MDNKTTPKEFVEIFSNVSKALVEIAEAKNNDYSGNQFAFKNFEMIERITDWRVSTADWILVRITDKVCRVATLLGWCQKVEDEKITDTLRDLSNYANILSIYLETNANK